MRNIDQFWMVYGMGQGAPTFPHPTEEEAVREARRLARCHPGIRFVVLEAKRAFMKIDVMEMPIGKPTRDDEIPF